MKKASVRFFFIAVVLLNAAIMGVNADHGDPHEAAWVHVEMAFVSIFIIEVLLKIFGFGIILFFIDLWNVFDFVVITTSMVELGATYAALDSDAGVSSTMGISVLRLLRVTLTS
jgi:hypothetical protein